MVIQKKTPNLMALLDSHTKEATPEVLIILKPLTPLPPRPSPPEPAKKKRKREKRPGKKVSEEGEIQGQPLQEQGKGSKSTKSQQKRVASESTGSEVATKHRPRIVTWNPLLALDRSASLWTPLSGISIMGGLYMWPTR